MESGVAEAGTNYFAKTECLSREVITAAVINQFQIPVS